MIKEIYLRNINDPYYSDVMEHSNDIESIIQQVKMILGTENGQVLGDYNFGANLKKLVFQTSLPTEKLESLIREQIYQYIGYKDTYSIDTKVKFGKAPDGSDIALVDIIINQQAVVGVIVA
jgi:phage baseplate assembly protein W